MSDWLFGTLLGFVIGATIVGVILGACCVLYFVAPIYAR
jgi:hypothetical protein